MMKYVAPLLIFFFLAGIASAGQSRPEQPEETASQTLMTAPIRFFQQYLSAADGDRCPMTPSCSSYAIQAIRRHGAVKGWIMACDRLMRCGHDELRRSPVVRTESGVRTLDPLDNNDLWRP